MTRILSPILLADTNERDNFSLVLWRANSAPTIMTIHKRAQELPNAITDLLNKEQMNLDELKALGFIRRDGSLTGSRIGAVTVNTLAWLKDIPVYDITANTLKEAITQLENSETKVVEQLTAIN